MEDVGKIKKRTLPRIIVCDLEKLDWIKFVDGTIFIDYHYLKELQGNRKVIFQLVPASCFLFYLLN